LINKKGCPSLRASLAALIDIIAALGVLLGQKLKCMK